MRAVIHTEDLGKRFRGGIEALNGLNLDVSEGSVFGLIGPDGAGKTTTLKILMNIIKSSSGQAEMLGVDSERLDRRTSPGSATFRKTRTCRTG